MFYRDSGAFAAHPFNSRLGCTFSTIRAYYFRDTPQLHHSDDKIKTSVVLLTMPALAAVAIVVGEDCMRHMSVADNLDRAVVVF